MSASTQNQALCAIIFLYRAVLRKELDWMGSIVRAKRAIRVPLVLTREEVRAILGEMRGIPWLMASLMYGAGLRLMECARLRVKDVDFARGEITVRDGNERKDRVTMLPATLKGPLQAHLGRVRLRHQVDLRKKMGSVELPGDEERSEALRDREARELPYAASLVRHTFARGGIRYQDDSGAPRA